MLGRGETYSQPLGVAGDIPRHTAQRQPVTVHGAPGAGALSRARLRRPVFQHRQHEPQQQQQGPRRPVPAAHLLPAPGGAPPGLVAAARWPGKGLAQKKNAGTKAWSKSVLGSKRCSRQAGRSTPPTFLLSFPAPSCSRAAPEGGNFRSWKTNRTDVAKATRQGATLAMPGEWVLGGGAHFTKKQLQCKEHPLQCNAMQCQKDRSRVLLALQRTNLRRNQRAFGRFFPGCNA